jgi:hypothetical protein
MIPDPRQIGDGARDGEGPLIPGKSGMGMIPEQSSALTSRMSPCPAASPWNMCRIDSEARERPGK